MSTCYDCGCAIASGGVRIVLALWDADDADDPSQADTIEPLSVTTGRVCTPARIAAALHHCAEAQEAMNSVAGSAFN